jgi:hydroxypyruvate isomerase
MFAAMPASESLRLVADEGFHEVEFWDWRERDIATLQQHARMLGVTVTACSGTTFAEPLLDPAGHEAALAHLQESLVVAQQLTVPLLVVHVGYAASHRSRAEQWQAAVEGLQRAGVMAAGAGAGVTLVVEPLNSIVDHPGYFLDSLPDALRLLDDVGHPAVRLLLDIYHMWVMHEDLLTHLSEVAPAVAHVHVADVPGRGEPGSGGIPWAAVLDRLREAGYDGSIGLECWPTTDVQTALRRCKEALDR